MAFQDGRAGVTLDAEAVESQRPWLPVAGVEQAGAVDREKSAAAVRDLLDDQMLDQMVGRIRADGERLSGPGGFLSEMLKAVLERGLAAELTEHLGYGKHDPAGNGSGNSRNGATPKTVLTEVGPVPLQVPRDRAGTFTPMLVPKGDRRLGGLSDVVISLYAGGMTVRDICHHLQRVYGTELSPDSVSAITDEVLDEVKAWQTRPLDEVYPIVYVDALVVKVRDGHQVRNKAAHLVVGVDADGVKHMLGIWIQNTEGSKFWLQVFTEMRNRGVRDVLIACCDGLEGLPEAIETIWPQTIVQTCTVHWSCKESTRRFAGVGEAVLWLRLFGRGEQVGNVGVSVVGGDDGDAVIVEDWRHVVDRVPQGAAADGEQFGEGIEAADAAPVEDRGEDRSPSVIFWRKTPPRVPGRRSPPRLRWRRCSIAAA